MKNKDQQLIWEAYIKEEDIQGEFSGDFPTPPPLSDYDITLISNTICNLVIFYRDNGFDVETAKEWIIETFKTGKRLSVYGWRPEFDDVLQKCIEKRWRK